MPTNQYKGEKMHLAYDFGGLILSVAALGWSQSEPSQQKGMMEQKYSPLDMMCQTSEYYFQRHLSTTNFL